VDRGRPPLSPMGTTIWKRLCTATRCVGRPTPVAHPSHLDQRVPRWRLGHDGVMDTPARLVPLEGAHNFRDLGGYTGLGDRQIRWGRLFRSDTLHELTVADVAQLRSLGLRTVIDLRTERELSLTGRGPLEPEEIAFRHLAVVREGADRTAAGEAVAAPAAPGEDLSERYLWYLEVGRDSLVEALTLLGDGARYPLVFHCAAGKDRTGVLAALVLEILGVDREVIVADYLLTAERMDLIMARYRADPAFAERIARTPASRLGVDGATMEGFLDGVADRFGGARSWAVGAGASGEALDRMTALLLDGAG